MCVDARHVIDVVLCSLTVSWWSNILLKFGKELFTFDFMWLCGVYSLNTSYLCVVGDLLQWLWMTILGFPGCFYMNFEYFYICLFLWLQLWISKFHCWFSFLKYFRLIWMKLLFFYLVSVICPMSALWSNGHKLPSPHYLLLICCVTHPLYVVHTSPLFVGFFSSFFFFFFFWDSLLWPRPIMKIMYPRQIPSSWQPSQCINYRCEPPYLALSTVLKTIMFYNSVQVLNTSTFGSDQHKSLTLSSKSLVAIIPLSDWSWAFL